MERSTADRMRRPGGVIAVEVLLYLYAALNLLAGVLLLIVGGASDSGPDRDLHGFEVFIGILLIIWGLLMLWLAREIAGGNEVARVLWVVLNGLEILAGVAALIQGHIGAGIISVVIPTLLIYLVFTPQAEQYFQRAGVDRPGPGPGTPSAPPPPPAR